ncbi:MAG: proline--tRNA ligase [Candidatus Firestonebacteria bacterium]
MEWTHCLIPTLKEIPSDAEIISHKLMLKAGLIKKLASGIYTLLPLGFKVMLKIINIVREEMNMAGAEELLMPILSPSELWKETGRWELYGEELFRIKDRQDRYFALGPTHEEVITDIARNVIKSYRDIPKNFYQIQNKFRDEIRPRFGVMRAREFMMKDAYSFDRDEKGSEITYKKMFDAYLRIFNRCGLRFKAVEAESGAIGGSFSHEFMVLAENGEEVIINCPKCDYAANKDKAEGISKFKGNESDELKKIEKVLTPDKKTIKSVTEFLKKEACELIKTLIYVCDGKPMAVLIKGDDELNENKLKRFLNAKELTMAEAKLVEKVSNSPVGFAGPVGLNNVDIIADNTIKKMKNFVVGSNEKDYHLINVNLDKDFKVKEFADLRFVSGEDICIKCGSNLTELRGIEVGHTFKLGTKYSEAMGAEFLDEDGKRKSIVMGCYGIGITRIMGAAIEQGNDEDGIIWPVPIAPYLVIITAINYKDEKIKELADSIYDILIKNNIEVLLDDRDVSAGVKFKDADLIGIPIRIIVGTKAIKENVLEVRLRKTKEEFKLKEEEVLEKIKKLSIEDLKK